MSDKALLVPAKNLTVLDPHTMVPLPIEGAVVELNTYWLRRIADGDVTQKQSPKSDKK